MSEKDLIEKLKKNERILYFLSDEEVGCLKEHRKHVQKLDTYFVWRDGDWYMDSSTGIYRIDPNYKPEPEYIECKIFAKPNKTKIFQYNYVDRCLYIAKDFPTFHAFKYADGTQSINYPIYKYDVLEWPVAVIFKKEGE